MFWNKRKNDRIRTKGSKIKYINEKMKKENKQIKKQYMKKDYYLSVRANNWNSNQ